MVERYSDRMLRPLDCFGTAHVREGNRLVRVELLAPSRQLLGSNDTRTGAPAPDEDQR